jgi:FkbM family methyltransferase
MARDEPLGAGLGGGQSAGDIDGAEPVPVSETGAGGACVRPLHDRNGRGWPRFRRRSRWNARRGGKLVSTIGVVRVNGRSRALARYSICANVRDIINPTLLVYTANMTTILWNKILQLMGNPRCAVAFARSLRSTYSQYGEDQVFRLLMQPTSEGTYLDVGSHHPVNGSNTYNLYFRGWRGLTIDPNPIFESEYRRYRPQETHLVEGVSSKVDDLTYFEFQDSLYNTLSEDRAQELERMGRMIIGRRTVPCRPLRNIVAEHFSGRQIDLLSVDCEGLDREVIESLDLTMNRPTVIVLEDYDQFRMFREGTGHSDLRDFLFSNGYRPIAQIAFSAIFVAEDWQQLFSLSRAYSTRKIQGGILPIEQHRVI